jgi:hypothetical protein
MRRHAGKLLGYHGEVTLRLSILVSSTRSATLIIPLAAERTCW